MKTHLGHGVLHQHSIVSFVLRTMADAQEAIGAESFRRRITC